MKVEKSFVVKPTNNTLDDKTCTEQRTFAFNELCGLAGTNDELTTIDICKNLFPGRYHMSTNIALDALLTLTNLGMISPIQISSNPGKNLRISRPSLLKKITDFENLISTHQEQLKQKMNLEVKCQVLRFLSGCGFLAAAIQLSKVKEKINRKLSKDIKLVTTSYKVNAKKDGSLIESS